MNRRAQQSKATGTAALGATYQLDAERRIYRISLFHLHAKLHDLGAGPVVNAERVRHAAIELELSARGYESIGLLTQFESSRPRQTSDGTRLDSTACRRTPHAALSCSNSRAVGLRYQCVNSQHP